MNKENFHRYTNILFKLKHYGVVIEDPIKDYIKLCLIDNEANMDNDEIILQIAQFYEFIN
jgi:hypothetical protein